jgi:hypothetical protein
MDRAMKTPRRLGCPPRAAFGPTTLGLGVLVLGLGVAEPVAAAVELLSHRAAYRLSLADAAGAVGVSDVRGGLVLEWRESCEGSISTQRLGFVATMGDGPDFSYDVRFSSWESPDHKRLRFNVRSFDGGDLFEEYQGEALLDERGSGRAAFAKPSPEAIELPVGTLFPTEHMRRLIEGAAEGEVVVSHDVFDGSGFEGLSRITAVIGRSKPVADEAAASGRLRWPVSLAYHDAGGADDMPSFEITFELSERGVLHDLVLDYGDFALAAELEQLETFEAPHCP